MHLEGELFATAQQLARAGWKGGRLGAWHITGEETVEPHQLTARPVKHKGVMDDFHVSRTNHRGAQPDIVCEGTRDGEVISTMDCTFGSER